MKAPDLERSHSPRSMEDRSPIQRYGVAVLAVLAAFLLRLSLDGYLGDKLAYGAFIIATTLVAWYAGYGPSIVTFVCGYLMADWFFVSPRHSFRWNWTADVGPNVSTFIVGATIILFGRSMHLARRRADAHAREAIAHQKKLEVEVLERKRVEEEVRQLNTELEKRVEQRTAELVASNEELESFTYSVSHDLRAPLRHVDGYAAMLEEEFGGQMPEEALKFVSKIRQGSENMRQLVDDLLNLSHVGKAELAQQKAALKPMVEAIVHDISLESDGRHIEWK